MPAESRSRRTPSRRQEEINHVPEGPWPSLVGFIFIALGAGMYLSLFSFDPQDVSDRWHFCSSLSVTDRPNDPPNNVMGPVGAWLSASLFLCFGLAAFILPTVLLYLGCLQLLIREKWRLHLLLGSALLLLSGPSLLSVVDSIGKDWALEHRILEGEVGGAIGYFLGKGLFANLIGRVGAFLFLLGTYFIGLSFFFGLHPVEAMRTLRDLVIDLFHYGREKWTEHSEELITAPRRAFAGAVPVPNDLVAEKTTGRRSALLPQPLPPLRARQSRSVADTELEVDDTVVISQKEVLQDLGLSDEEADSPAEQLAADPPAAPLPKIIDSSERQPKQPNRPSLTEVRRLAAEKKAPPGSNSGSSLIHGDFAHYQLPDVDLLDYDEHAVQKPADKNALLATQQTIVQTLATFGIKVTPGDITRGPTITRYEILPEAGLRVNRITALEADLARATKAERINILAPIPGKDTVGIELANADKVPVPIRELLLDPTFTDTKAKLPLALGKDVYGQTIVGDLAAMPHLLVAGATGSGKSVCINSIITSLLFQFTPNQLRFIMIDPKVVEMQHYNDLPHLIIPVVTDPKKTLMALNWVVNEMENRYRVFAECGVRNFDSFNKRPRPVKRTAAQLAALAAAEGGDASVAATAENTADDLIDNLNDDVSEEEIDETDLTAEDNSELVDDEDNSALAEYCAADDDEEDDDVAEDDTDEETNEDDEIFDFKASEVDDVIAAHVLTSNLTGKKDINPSAPFQKVPEASELSASSLVAHRVDVKTTTPRDTVWTSADDDDAQDDHNDIPDTYPYIVVIIDELADLMQTAPADIEVAICRIAQKARAAGIHLILATQTPRADVITGVIKANIPSKIAFQVSNALDSRVILDTKGAEKLVGKGDMLYLPPGSAKLSRAQGAFVTDEEVMRLVNACKQQAKPVYAADIKASLEGSGASSAEVVSDEDEECYNDCLEVIAQEKRASTSLLQRRLRLGYTRAARMMDILEQRGIVGPGDGAKPREILVDLSELE